MSCHFCIRSVARLCGLIALLVGASACSDGRDRPPLTSPAPTPAVPSVTYTISGVVSTPHASGPTLLPGITVRDSVSGRSTTTDTKGFYMLSGLRAGTTAIVVTGAGYVSLTQVIVITAETSFDVELIRIPTYTLSGIVFEETAAGRAPVEAVSVYCDSCGEGHVFSTTDAQGFYSFTGVLAGTYPLIIWKEGYTVVGSTHSQPDGSGTLVPQVHADTSYDIQLARQ